MMQIRGIIKRAGGPLAIAKASETGRYVRRVAENSVTKWRVNGIPSMHMQVVIDCCLANGQPVTAEEIVAANMAILREKMAA